MFDINAYRDECKSRIQTALPELAHVLDYDESHDLKGDNAFPAAFVNIVDIHPGIDPGDGRVGLLLRTVIHIITKRPEGGSRAVARKQVEALAVAAIPALFGERFAGLESPLVFVGGYGDLGDDKHKSRAEWGLEFTARISAGQELWTDLPDLEPPEHIFSDFGTGAEEATQ